MTPGPVRIPCLAIIDDAEFDQMMYRRIIERSGMVGTLYSFLSAEEAHTFLLRSDTPKVDVILLDVNMPGMSGFEFLELATKTLGAEFADMVIIMLTTSLNPQDMARARAFDVVKSYLCKPLEDSHLAFVARLLDDSRKVA